MYAAAMITVPETAHGMRNPPVRHGLVAVLGQVLALALVLPAIVVAQSNPPVRDFADIQSGEVAIVLDPGGTLATVEVTTSMDAACAVVFGEDPSFGRLATDPTMAGSGHRDHNVPLGGLAPDTAYVLRLQGSGLDGNLYRSRIYRFRTPAVSTTAPADLAIGARVVDVSSEFSTAYAATNAVDGDLSTEWSSLGDGDDAFITIDLGHVADVTSVAFRTRQMGDGTAITDTFSVTVDGQEYGPFPAGTEPVPVLLSGQILRFDVDTSTGGNTGAIEIQVYGAPAADASP